MSAKGLDDQAGVRTGVQVVEILHRNNGVVLGSDDGGGCGDSLKVVVDDRIILEIGSGVVISAVAFQEPFGHLSDIVHVQDGGKVIVFREQTLFDHQGPAPFFQKVFQNKPAVVDAIRGLVRIEYGTDADDLLQIVDGLRGATASDSQGKIAAQGESGKHHRLSMFRLADLAHGIEDFVEEHRVENSGVQVVTGAVVP